MDLPLILRSIVLGFTIAAPVGPIGVLTIRRTLAQGRAMGLATGLGAATADATYGLLGALGLSAVTALLVGAGFWLRLVGGLFVVYLGLQTLRAKPAAEAAPARAARGLLGAYAGTVLLTLTNPLTILAFAAMIASLGPGASSPLNVVLGVFAGSALWWLLLTTVTGFLHGRMDARLLRWVNLASGAILIIFGIVAVVSVL